VAILSEGTTKSLAVLLVDDDEITRRIGKALLTASGHLVIACDSGRAALDTAACAEFDVVLMDIHMPDMNGMDVARRLKAMNKSGRKATPVLALTANAGPEDIESYRDAGIDGVIAKPLRRGRVEEVLAELTTNRPPTAVPNDKPDILDRARIALLADEFPPGKFGELIDQAAQSIRETAAAMAEAWRNNDIAQTGKCAHRLAGVAGNFGCTALANVTIDIERSCAQGSDGRNLTETFNAALAESLFALDREKDAAR
jgi:CheY-like chemotaxis protein